MINKKQEKMKLDYPYCYDYEEVNSVYKIAGENKMSFFKKHLDKIWGFGIGFVVGFLVAGWASSVGALTGF